MSKHSRNYVPELDGLRGISIAFVLLYHGWSYDGQGWVGRAIDAIRSVGWCGVDIFFVLSGFLITGILLSTKSEPRYWRNFFIRRGLRIFPLYYAVLGLLMLGSWVIERLQVPMSDPSLAVMNNMWVNFAYLTDFALGFKGKNYVPLEIAWSLAIEEQFYLVYPFIVRWLRASHLMAVLLAVVLIAPVLRALTWAHGAQPLLGPYALPYCRMDALAYGALARLLLDVGRPALRQTIARLAPALCIVAFTILYSWYRGDVRFIIIGYSMTSIAAAAVLIRVMTSTEPSVLRSVLGNSGLVYVGRISYGIYLLHLPVRALVVFAVHKMTGGSPYATVLLSTICLTGLFAATLVAASVSYYLFEKPLLALKARWAPAITHRA